MKVRSVLAGLWVPLLWALAFASAQDGEDPIDQITRLRTHNTGLQQRSAIPCPSGRQNPFSSFADFLTSCVHNGTGGGVLGQGFRSGGSYSGLSYVPSGQDRFVGKLVFRDYDLALEEMGRVLENRPLVAILNALWLRGVAIADPSSLSSVVLTVYVPEPPPPPSSGGSGGGSRGRGDDNRDAGHLVQTPDPSLDRENQARDVTYLLGSHGSGRDERERARSVVRTVCSLSERVASLFWPVGAEPVKVKFYRRSDGIGFAGDALFMARVEALNRASEARRVHLIGLRNSRGWRGAYGEPSTGTLVAGFWNMFDRLSNAVSCRE
jgi:hypothetical protein